VGTGPGDPGHMTSRARQALEEADVVLGYGTYLEFIKGMTGHAEVLAYAMGEEMARARDALALAGAGRSVVVVSGGDPGVYGMAGPVLEALPGHEGIQVEVVPGVTAAVAAAAALGAPLSADFAVVSLSDILVPWHVIDRRLRAVAAGDMVAVLYNPRSHGRRDHLRRALDILKAHRSYTTPVGLVKNAGRPGQTVTLSDLGRFDPGLADMGSTVIVGNSYTFIRGGIMVTPRGYAP